MPRGGARPGAGRPRKAPADQSAPPKKKAPAKQPAAGHAPDGKKAADAPPSWPFGTEPPSPPADLSELSPLDYLLSLVRNPETDPRVRLQAASIAAPYCHHKKGEASGKKLEAEARQKAAAEGRFSRRQPPKLVAAGGKKVE